jgi:hypothetical protein
MTTGRRLAAYSRAVTHLVHEARLLAEIRSPSATPTTTEPASPASTPARRGC